MRSLLALAVLVSLGACHRALPAPKCVSDDMETATLQQCLQQHGASECKCEWAFVSTRYTCQELLGPKNPLTGLGPELGRACFHKGTP